MNPHHDEDVLKVRANDPWRERKRTRLLEDDGDYVIPNVPFAQKLQEGTEKKGLMQKQHKWAGALKARFNSLLSLQVASWSEAKFTHVTEVHSKPLFHA